ncbi:GGDEF domain-containing protein [Kineococcus sp. SYSU DK003]|uniref:GGDEF domain-containing protein n=1 Tax=Kineococcus sp. SYSU DK003 TaxID=3383124 RepID=UPI003D7E3DF1
MSTASQDRSLIPLADRIRWTAVLRLLLVTVAVVLWWAAGARPQDGRELLVLAGGHLLVTGVLVLLTRAGRRAARRGLDLCLLLDSVALTIALPALGELGVALFAVHAAGVTLATSFRTGVKVAGAHTVLVLCLLQADVTGVADLGGRLGAFPRNFVAFAALLWVATLSTATFAAVNERELRRRRLDAEALHGLLSDLATAADAPAVADLLTSFARTELPARRAQLVRGDVTDASFVRARRSGRPVLLRSPEPGVDPWLARTWPDARGIAVLPLPVGTAEGWLVVDFGGRRGLERRVLRTAEQAVSHAALALARAEAVADLRRAATSDGLTGVANRRTLDEALAQQDHTVWSLALIDLDHFKAVNDTHGHQAGDDVLRAAAAALSTTAREGDLVARYGGEEFAVLLPGTDQAAALLVAERLRAAVAAATRPRVTCSIGIATARGPRPAVDVLAAADRALYSAKAAGRDRCVPAGR